MTLSELLDKYIVEQLDTKRSAEQYIENSLKGEIDRARHKALELEQRISIERCRIATAEECIRLLKIAKESQ